MSVLRNQPESEVSGTAYTFLKPMPSLRPSPAPASPSLEVSAPAAPRSDVGAILFPGKDVAPRPVATGVVLGSYVIEEEIGRGGMGAVFRALDSRLDRIVALKVLGPDLSRDRSSVTRFQNEARAAARLDHESIARVHDVGHDHGLYYIAFEFVPGSNLREVLSQNGGLLPVDEAVGYTLQIADALRHTSAVEVVHRDIKPSNIILAPNGRAKLVDWGLARQNSLDLSQDLTQTGTTLGTFDYISPEQAIDPRNVDVRSDIYSLGCTLFHMLTGEPPYPRGSMFEKVVKHHNPEPPDASQRNRDVPPELSEVVRRMMAADPVARYATSDELIADLVSVATELGLHPTSPASAIWTTSYSQAPRDRIRAGWGWLGAFVTLIVVVWSVDRSSRRLPLEPVDSSIPTANLTKPSRQSASAPEAPQLTSSDSARQKAGIVQGTSDTSREFSKESPGGAVAPSVSKIDFDSLGQHFSNNLVESMKSLIDPARQPSGAQANGQGFVLLSSSDEPSQRFSSLEAAMTAASDDDVIELDFDGYWNEIVRPIRTSRRITIRAAQRRRPQLEIGLTRDEASSSAIPSPKFFNVSAGSLTVVDVDLVLSVPAGSSERWSIFALTQGARLSLRGVSITVQNRDHRPVGVIDAAGGAKAIARAVTEAMAERPIEISVESCIVRGVADLIWQDGSDVADIRVVQSALALNGALFRQSAGPATDAMSAGRGPNEMLIEHVTAALERPLVLIELGDRETTRPLQLDCRNSVIKLTDASQPLISVTGQGDVNDYLDSLTWNGRHNWFDLAGPAVEISTPGTGGPLLTTLRIDEWLRRWADRGASEAEQRATGELFANGEAWRQGDFTRIEPDDFTLNGSGANPVLQGADDGGPAGVDLEQRTFPKTLPALPRARSAEKNSRRRYASEPDIERIELPETRR